VVVGEVKGGDGKRWSGRQEEREAGSMRWTRATPMTTMRRKGGAEVCGGMSSRSDVLVVRSP
jgi:hypothetical protein